MAGIAVNAESKLKRRYDPRVDSVASLFWNALRAVTVFISIVAISTPFVFLFLNSVKPPNQFLSIPIQVIPSEVTWEHYRSVFDHNEDTVQFLTNSLIITAGTTVISVFIGSLAAYSLSRLELPFVVWLMLTFFDELPKELERSAMLDGCGPWQRFTLIVLPLTGPALATAAILTALLSWNEFLMAAVIAPKDAKTLPVRISAFITDKGILWGPMSAMSSVIVIPVMVFALFVQRYLVRGLTLGAVKG